MALRAIADPLAELTAEDLMSRDVLMLRRESSLQDALRALARAGIGGAPVVDERGRCIGVFSVSDCNRRARNGNRAAPTPPVSGCVCSEWEVVESALDGLPDDAMSRYMTADPVLVQPATPIGEVAQMMVDAHIHRLIVAREDRRPIGIVSSTDVPASVARAVRAREYEEDNHASPI